MSGLDGKVLVDAAEQVASWKRPLLISHMKPDGDALGSLTAMRAILWSLGADPIAALFDPMPTRYALFDRYGPIPVLGRDIHESVLSAVDAVMLLDTCAYKQIDPLADWLRGASCPKLVVDHHLTRDELADVYLTDFRAAATCLILYEWARVVDWPIDRAVSEALFIGIAMDTGWFRHSNTDERALSASAELMARGAKAHELFQGLFQRESPERVRLLGVALETLELLAQGRIAVMALSLNDFGIAGATPADTEDILNEPMRIDSVVVSVLLAEQGDGVVRVSFRSKPPLEDGAPDVDSAALAQAFGGGGHRRAAAARIDGSLAEVHGAIIEHIERVLSD